MKLFHAPLLLLAGVLVAAAQEPPSVPSEAKPSKPKERKLETLFADSYPLDVSISLPAALYHWVDCLAGTSEAKTIPVHQQEYIEKFGPLTEQDTAQLKKFRAIRLRGGKQSRQSIVMLGVFLEAPNLSSAFDQVHAGLGAEGLEGIATTLEHFRPKFETIWQEGRLPRAFLESAAKDEARKHLEDFLARVARFFGVDPSTPPRPMLVLMPVPDGGGTHAQAVSRALLIEIRPGERLWDEVAPIVHENSHYLWNRMSMGQQAKLAEVIKKSPAGKQAWQILREALPTAIGQGVAAHTFQGPTWSETEPWYHTPEVDSYAKVIYPLVQEALDSGGAFDELLLKRMLRRFPGGAVNENRPRLSPR